MINYASLHKSSDCERLTVETTPLAYHRTPTQSMSPATSSVPADLNPVDILKPFFQFMANQQQKQQQQQQFDHHRPASPLMTTSQPFDTALIKTIDDENGRQIEKMPQLTNGIQQQQQQQQVTSTTTTGISFISNGLQMQIINQQSSTTTVYPPAATAAASSSVASIPPSSTSASATSINDVTRSSNHQSENDLSIEVRSLQMKYLDDDQLAITNDDDRQSPTPPSTVRQSPQIFDKNMSFATQKYLQKYNLISGYNRQQQYYVTSDDSDILTSSSPPHQRMLLPLPPTASPPIFTQPPAPHAPQAKILDLSQIRKLPKLL